MAEEPSASRRPSHQDAPDPDRGAVEGRALALLAATSDLVWFADERGRVVEANPAARSLLSWDLEDRAPNVREAFTVASQVVLATEVQPSVQGAGTWAGELTMRDAQGARLPVSAVVTRGQDADGSPWTATVARDLRRLEHQEQSVRHQATHDRLTGLLNRDGFDDLARIALARSDAVLMMCGIDHLKLVNETHGREAGNGLLRQMAERLREGLRGDDIPARVGGDEFVVLLPGLDDAAATAVARRLLARLAEPYEVAGRQLRTSASIGLVTSGGSDDTGRLVQDADMAMYLAKSSGRGRVEVYDAEVHRRLADRLALRDEVADALGREELRLVFQPIISFDDQRPEGAEALLRWDHPTRGLIPPLEFIPLLEETGDIVEVGRWVLEQAIAQVAAWRADGLVAPAFRMHVNVSALQLSRSLVEDVVRALDTYTVEGRSLVVELTETSIARELDLAVQVLQELRDEGVHVALDDFGTGFSTFGSLQSLPIDEVKIDRSLVLAFERTGEATRIASICQMATSLGMRTVAEGVEDAARADELRALRCDLGQGYLWSRPVPPAELVELLASPAP